MSHSAPPNPPDSEPASSEPRPPANPSASDPAPDPLHHLLVDLEQDPATLVETLRAEREPRSHGQPWARDLDRAELDFLCDLPDARLADSLRDRVEAARRAALAAEHAALLASPAEDPDALFDLVELRVAYLCEGLDGDAAVIAGEIEARIASIDRISDALRYEAGERFAVLSAQEEGFDLDRRITSLRVTGDVLAALAERTGDSRMAKLARRLRRRTCDRVLAQRLERLLSRRGAAALENTSLFLLFVVVGLLFFELSLPEDSVWLWWCLAIDASICVFFIAEFFLKFVLAPARASWFVRNAVTDLLPALPMALWFLTTMPAGGEATVLVRALRFLRVTWFARYVQALRPLFRLVSLLLFLIKGMDALVQRFSALLNRNFVFFERVVMPSRRQEPDERALLFRALRREHVLLADLPVAAAAPLLVARTDALLQRLAEPPPPWRPRSGYTRVGADARDVPVEHAIEHLHRLRPEELGTWLPRADILAIDRVVRIVNAPVVRSVPIVSWFASSPPVAATPEERVVDLGRRIAIVLERWRERALHVADLHGIVTGPQVLDRVASAMVKASQRPAVRLLLFGGLFTLVRVLIGADGPIGQFLGRFVGTPLVVLGSICLIVLTLGRWLKSLAGQASDTFKLTSEAHFIGLLELGKRRCQDDDLLFLARRVFRWDIDHWGAAALLGHHVRAARTGRRQNGVEEPEDLRDELDRVALLYLHFLDGAILHENDIKTTEQLLANLSLENIRNGHLDYGKRERKRLKQLALHEGSMFKGPYVWFRFITESVAVEAAKRITDYNRHCLTLAQRRVATPRQRRAFAWWLKKRRCADSAAVRAETVAEPGKGPLYHTTEFNALDFLSADPQREEHVERVFGRHVVRILRDDRRTMIREIFGTRPLHEMPRAQRTLNVFAFYNQRLSRGRLFLLPLYLVGLLWRGIGMTVTKTVRIVREILTPEAAALTAERGRAPFAVALRKIHRMKGPTLLEAMRLRVSFDPAYCGAPPGWSLRREFEDVSELERDMDFLWMREQAREEMRRLAENNRRRIEELHHLIQRLPPLFDEDDPELRRRGERAVSIAYMTDQRQLRTLFRAEEWFERTLARVESIETRLPSRFVRRSVSVTMRGGRSHVIDRWLATHLPDRKVSRRGRGNLRRLWHDGDDELRATVRAWLALPVGVRPTERAGEIAREIYATRDDISRELAALRAVQSLSVLDVRNYRQLVFDLGGYADDGESRELAEELP